MLRPKVLKLLLIPFLAVVLSVCNIVDVPNFFIDVRTPNIAYNDPSNIPVQYKYSAEKDQHFCRFVLSNGSGAVLESITELVPANVELCRNLNVALLGGGDGRYNFRMVVQTETAGGELIDLKFLDKSVNFCIDKKIPAAPVIISPKPTLSSQDIEVEITHEDNSDPDASPTTLYYTLNGSAPTISSTRYSGKFTIKVKDVPAPAGSVQVRTIAVDCANPPGPEEQFTYKFLDIEKVTNAGSTDPDPNISRSVIALKELHGFGFTAIDITDKVTVYDHDNTRVATAFYIDSDNEIWLTIYTGTVLYDPNGTGFEAGTGTIKITDNDTAVSDTFKININ